jgi:hypothetical protein
VAFMMLWMAVVKLLSMLLWPSWRCEWLWWNCCVCCCGLHDAVNGCGEIAVYVVLCLVHAVQWELQEGNGQHVTIKRRGTSTESNSPSFSAKRANVHPQAFSTRNLNLFTYNFFDSPVICAAMSPYSI